MKMTSSMTTEEKTAVNAGDFDRFNASLTAHVTKLAHAGHRFYLTDVPKSNLISAYLHGFEHDAHVAEHNCRCCFEFLERYGNLVFISNDETAVPVLWSVDQRTIPAEYRNSVKRLYNEVSNGRIIAPLLVEKGSKLMGTKRAGGWSHFHLPIPNFAVYDSKKSIKDLGQRQAEVRENVLTLSRALAVYKRKDIIDAIRVLKSGKIHKMAGTLAHAEWFLKVYDRTCEVKGSLNRHNVLFDLAARAPDNYSHIKSGMLGVLLELVQTYSKADTIAKHFNEKMDPTKYMRTRSGPKEGNINQAEKAFEKLGLQQSLNLRAAKLEDLQLIWKPIKGWTDRYVEPSARGGMFDSIRPSKSRLIESNSVENITFSRFIRRVLPEAKRITYMVQDDRDTYASFAVQSTARAKPIWKYDSPNRRNNAVLYTYSQPKSPIEWNLNRNTEVEVTGIAYNPQMWNGCEVPDEKCSAVFILKGAYDKSSPHMPIFPENLRSDLHQFRNTIENYARSKKLEDVLNSSASGIMLSASSRRPRLIKVYTDHSVRQYMIDRWD